MRYLTLRKVVLALATLASVGVLTACTNNNGVFRDYYIDRSCNTYYVDMFGNRVYENGKYDSADFTGLPMQQDANGRWFYQDAWGNRVYKSRFCQ
jgi:hypothetical protein